MKEIISVKPLENYHLLLEFDNGENRIFDMSTFEFDGVFEYIKDPNNFKKVQIVYGALTWFPPGEMEIDLCPDTVYMESTPHIEKISS